MLKSTSFEHISGFGYGNVSCWTCDERMAKHMEYRDALNAYEFTCDICHQNEYPEQYEDEDEDEDETYCLNENIQKDIVQLWSYIVNIYSKVVSLEEGLKITLGELK